MLALHRTGHIEAMQVHKKLLLHCVFQCLCLYAITAILCLFYILYRTRMLRRSAFLLVKFAGEYQQQFRFAPLPCSCPCHGGAYS